MTDSSITTLKTSRPPKRSVSMPNGMRPRLPSSTGRPQQYSFALETDAFACSGSASWQTASRTPQSKTQRLRCQVQAEAWETTGAAYEFLFRTTRQQSRRRCVYNRKPQRELFESDLSLSFEGIQPVCPNSPTFSVYTTKQSLPSLIELLSSTTRFGRWPRKWRDSRYSAAADRLGLFGTVGAFPLKPVFETLDRVSTFFSRQKRN